MTSYRRFIPPLLLLGGAAASCVIALMMVDRRRNDDRRRQKTDVDHWESEGGRVAASEDGPIPDGGASAGSR